MRKLNDLKGVSGVVGEARQGQKCKAIIGVNSKHSKKITLRFIVTS